MIREVVAMIIVALVGVEWLLSMESRVEEMKEARIAPLPVDVLRSREWSVEPTWFEQGTSTKSC